MGGSHDLTSSNPESCGTGEHMNKHTKSWGQKNTLNPERGNRRTHLILKGGQNRTLNPENKLRKEERTQRNMYIDYKGRAQQ